VSGSARRDTGGKLRPLHGIEAWSSACGTALREDGSPLSVADGRPIRFSTMTFHSVLFERPEDGITTETVEAPVFFVDLNLDQIVDAITAGRDEYNLKPFFYISLNGIDAIRYRHEVMRDLENNVLFEYIKSFAQRMRAMREHLTQADKLRYKYQKESWFLDAVEIYCDAVERLA